MNGSQKSRLTLTSVLAGAVILIIVVLVCVHSWQQKIEIRTTAVTYQDITDPVSNLGKVELIDKFEPHAAVPGTVEKLFVKLNDTVRKGQLLIKMDDSDAVSRLATANSSLSAAEAATHDQKQGGNQEELNKFKADLSGAQLQHQQAVDVLNQRLALQKTGAASPAEVAQAQSQVNSTQARVDAIRMTTSNRYSSTDVARTNAQMADARAAVSAASQAIGGADVHSPIDGTVFALGVSQYDYVPAGGELLSIGDLQKIRVRAFYDEPEIGKLAVGQPVRITWDAKPGKEWHGHVSVTPTSITNYGTRNVGECIITVDDAKGDLLPNTNVTATVITRQQNHVLTIPHEALRTQGSQNYVLVLSGDRLVKTPVQVGIVTIARVQITGGLSEGQKLALTAVSNHDLTDGLRVIPVD